MRSLLLCVSSSLMLLVAPVTAQPAPTSPPLPTFDPAAATPYFTEGPGAAARSRFSVEDWPGAARLFDAYVKANPKAGDLPEARFLAAYALSKAGSFEEAAARFEALVKSFPLLADHHRLYAARALLAAKQYERALGPARAVAADSPLGADALLVQADALRLAGGTGPAAAVELYRKYVESYPESWRAAEARFHLGLSRELAATGGRLSEAQGAAASPSGATGATGKGATGKGAKAGGAPNAKNAKDAKNAKAAKDARGTKGGGSGKAGASAVATGLDLARADYRFVYIHFPTSSWAAEARTRLTALASDGSDPLALTPAEHLARGLALFEQMRNEDSESELAAALTAQPGAAALDATQQCVAAFHRAQSVFKQRNRPRAAALFDEAAARCEKAPKGDAQAADLHAKSLYQGARCHAARKEPGTAIRQFARIEAEHPTHSYADDARQRIAEILDDVLDKLPATAPPSPDPAPAKPPVARSPEAVAAILDAAVPGKIDPAVLRATRDALLSSMAEKYPKGDMGGEALFRLALRAFEEGRLGDAQALLDKELGLYPREEGWWEAGRTLYWLGRIAALQHKAGEAAALWSRAAREYPLSYYALQALGRLREAAPDEARRLIEALRSPVPTAEELAWRFPPDATWGKPAFLRGVELVRLGLGVEARRELAAAGIQSAGRGSKLEDPAREPLLWLAAVLYDRAGEWALSHAIPRYVLVDYARRWPVGDNRRRWLISYPRGYGELVVDHAGKNGQPAALQFAIIREESAFDPTDESFANAVGLTQLTQAPAKRFAQGLPYTREALRDPVINITIGARELGDLWKRTGGQAALTIAGYNAGDGAVRRWMRAAPASQPLDQFIEHIPYDETRGYTKRVLGTWFAYHWLYEQGDPVPSLSSGLKAF